MKKRFCKFDTSVKSENPGIVVHSDAACRNQTKIVEVAYKCRPLEFRSKIICENDTINIKCKRNARIAIYSATFGRVHSQSVQCPQPPGVDEESKNFQKMFERLKLLFRLNSLALPTGELINYSPYKIISAF